MNNEERQSVFIAHPPCYQMRGLFVAFIMLAPSVVVFFPFMLFWCGLPSGGLVVARLLPPLRLESGE
jgi:hypothetical protein